MANSHVIAGAFVKPIQTNSGFLGSALNKVWNGKSVRKVVAPVTVLFRHGFDAVKTRLGYASEGKRLSERDINIADINQHVAKKEMSVIFNKAGPFLEGHDNSAMLLEMVEETSPYRPLLINLGAQEDDLHRLAQAIGSEREPLLSLEHEVRARVTRR